MYCSPCASDTRQVSHLDALTRVRKNTDLGARVQVQSGAVREQPSVAAHAPVQLVLFADGSHRDRKQQSPTDANFAKHFYVDRPDPRVQCRTHEVVVDPVTAHTVVVAKDVHDQGEREARDRRDRQQGSVQVDDLGQFEQVEVVRECDERDRRVDARVGVAVVRERLAAERTDGQALLRDAGQDERERELDREERQVEGRRALRRRRRLSQTRTHQFPLPLGERVATQRTRTTISVMYLIKSHQPPGPVRVYGFVGVAN